MIVFICNLSRLDIGDSRLQSASGRSVDARGSHRSQATKATGRLTGDPVLFHSPREGDLVSKYYVRTP
jgi:hypothetical protein